MTDDTDDGADVPPREEFRHDPIEHATVQDGMTVGELVAEYGNAGIGAGALHEAVDITAAMFEEDVTTFVGFAGAMVPAGMRRIVAEIGRASCRERVCLYV